MYQFSADLLAQAKHLAVQSTGKPKQADLRRSISTSYYALFHFFIHESSRQIAGTLAAKEDLKHLTARAFEHGKMKAVCLEFGKTTPINILKPFWTSLKVPAGQDIQLLAGTFVQLQELRHQADYDLNVSFSKQEALDAQQLAQDAINAWHRLKLQNRELAEFFGLLLLIWPLVEKRK
jgi:uncharacterized protein (UPF0332 family)